MRSITWKTGIVVILSAFLLTGCADDKESQKQNDAQQDVNKENAQQTENSGTVVNPEEEVLTAVLLLSNTGEELFVDIENDNPFFGTIPDDILDENGEYLGNVMQRTDFNNLLMGFTGGFLFTGFLLGISFLLGAALIIYYKQYSEGHEDKKSYKILQEVGMSQQAVKKTINSQTLLVFFMPLAMATLHFVVALVMLKQMLMMFGVVSSSMIYTVSGVTLLAVVLIYFVIYKWTSRTYYRIIER